jgi:hypothetical protein
MNIDETMNQFRLASRELFNNYFRSLHPYPATEGNWTREESFQEVQALLFKKQVIEPFKLGETNYGDVQSQIQVELRAGTSAPIMLNREIKSGYWDHPQKEISEDARLLFISFFDFDQLDYRDHQYIRVEVHDWTSHPELINKHALIERQYAQFSLVQK